MDFAGILYVDDLLCITKSLHASYTLTTANEYPDVIRQLKVGLG